jgi:hypothetical protein
MSMRMLSFIYVIVCGLFEWNQIFQVFFIICLYMYCYWRSNYQEGVGIPLSVLTPSHMYACPNPAPGFPVSYVVVFSMYNELR